MGAPAAAVMAVARSKTARRALLTVASVFIVGVVSVAAPLLVALFLSGAAGRAPGRAGREGRLDISAGGFLLEGTRVRAGPEHRPRLRVLLHVP